MEVLKISNNSNPGSVAGAIAAVLKEKGKVELQAIGAGAVNQAVKAIAIARGYTATSNENLICMPIFTQIKIENEEKSGIKFIVREEK